MGETSGRFNAPKKPARSVAGNYKKKLSFVPLFNLTLDYARVKPEPTIILTKGALLFGDLDQNQ